MNTRLRLLTLMALLAGLLCGSAPAASRGVPGAIFADGFEGNFRIVPIDLLGAVAERNFGHQVQVLPPASTVVLYAIDSGPPGLSIDSNGVLSWTPGLADGGPNTVSVRAEDDQGAVDTETFVIEVLLPNSPPLIDTIGERIVAANQTLSLTVPASDPDVGDVLSYALDVAPGGMQLNPGNGLLSWTPTLADVTPRIGHLDPTAEYQQIIDRLVEWVAFTPLQNATGEPSISLPLAHSASGLPVGMMFSAPVGHDARLLELAYELEEARPWRRIQG